MSVLVMSVLVMSVLVMSAFVGNEGDDASTLRECSDAFTFEARTNPKQHIGVLQIPCIGWTNLIIVRVCCACNQKVRRADTFHKRGGDGMDRLDACDDAQICLLCVCGGCRKHDGEEREDFFHFTTYVVYDCRWGFASLYWILFFFQLRLCVEV